VVSISRDATVPFIGFFRLTRGLSDFLPNTGGLSDVLLHTGGLSDPPLKIRGFIEDIYIYTKNPGVYLRFIFGYSSINPRIFSGGSDKPPV